MREGWPGKARLELGGEGGLVDRSTPIMTSLARAESGDFAAESKDFAHGSLHYTDISL